MREVLLVVTCGATEGTRVHTDAPTRVGRIPSVRRSPGHRNDRMRGPRRRRPQLSWIASADSSSRNSDRLASASMNSGARRRRCWRTGGVTYFRRARCPARRTRPTSSSRIRSESNFLADGVDPGVHHAVRSVRPRRPSGGLLPNTGLGRQADRSRGRCRAQQSASLPARRRGRGEAGAAWRPDAERSARTLNESASRPPRASCSTAPPLATRSS